MKYDPYREAAPPPPSLDAEIAEYEAKLLRGRARRERMQAFSATISSWFPIVLCLSVLAAAAGVIIHETMETQAKEESCRHKGGVWDRYNGLCLDVRVIK